MKRIIDTLMGLLDNNTEALTRRIAQRSSRRGFISRGSTFLLGSMLLPILPYEAHGGSGMPKDEGVNNPDSCDYWRYCAIDGNLCNQCGGSVSQCPPGAAVSQVAWVGTCRNPNDGKDYLISYNDCCGKAQCEGLECVRNERERPGYDMGVNNDVSWCMANASKGYHCTVAAVVGIAD